ncbi:MAG: Uma2 family endonuclease [bacterium]|nr:Uma2 family endonuclease [bacterium]
MPAPKPLAVDEFLDWDSGDERRYELVDGVPVAMAAPSGAHQIIAVNFGRRLAEALDERPPCTARAEAPIAVVGRDDMCHVADLAVTCRPHEPGERLTPQPPFDGPSSDNGPQAAPSQRLRPTAACEKPLVIVEILSSSTENKDRRVKLPDYRAIPSVEEIVLLDQQTFYCEVHRRLSDGRWLTDLLRHPEARLRLESIVFDQPLAAIYANVRFEEP